MPAGSRCRCALHWGASFLAFPRGGQAPSGVGVTLGTRPGLLQTGTLVRASALSLPNGTWLAGRVRSAGQAPGRRPCMGRPDDQPTSGTHGPPARPGSAHAARPPECQLLCSCPEQSQSAKRSPRGGERGSEGAAGYVPGKAGLVCPRGGKGVCCMASWWSLVNCWGRRDTRAKKVIVIEYKSHHITKAVTELRTGRGPCAHMADAAELKDLAWESRWAGAGGPAEPVLPGLPGGPAGASQGSHRTGLGGRAAPGPLRGMGAPDSHRTGLAGSQSVSRVLTRSSGASVGSPWSGASVGSPWDGRSCKPCPARPCARPHHRTVSPASRAGL